MLALIIAHVAKMLDKKIKPKPVFTWPEDCEKGFISAKQALAQATILVNPNNDAPYNIKPQMPQMHQSAPFYNNLTIICGNH